MMSKTIGAITSAIGVTVLWVVCLRMLLSYAGKDDPGAYVVIGGVFLMLPAAAVLLIGAIRKDRAGYWNTTPACEHGCHTQEEWLTKHGDTEATADEYFGDLTVSRTPSTVRRFRAKVCRM